MSVEKKIYGALAGAAIGEAMAVMTSAWTTELILKEYGKYVDTLLVPPVSSKAKGLSKAGQVTDGFSFSYMMINSIIENGGVINSAEAEEVIVEWGKNPDYMRFAEINSSTAYNQFAKTGVDYRYPYLTFDHHRATYEGAARAVAIAPFFPGEMEMAIEQLVLAYRSVFNNTFCMAGAGAAVAAMTTAMEENASYYDVLAAAVYGAKRGMDVAESYRVQPAACASVQRRIELAIDIGMKHQNDFAKAMQELEDCVGTGNFANESVATAIGCIAACRGDAMESLKMAVNIGNTTDAIANIVGGIVGALHPEAIRPEDAALVEQVNGFDLHAVSERIAGLNVVNESYYISY